ncbi:hypothetical protein BDZ97DRAFT_1757743 [Flammula alnicola]|nr:hypothetical protein BDZ97DRAFT_1757743 [Flammula alnicola]
MDYGYRCPNDQMNTRVTQLESLIYDKRSKKDKHSTEALITSSALVLLVDDSRIHYAAACNGGCAGADAVWEGGKARCSSGTLKEHMGAGAITGGADTIMGADEGSAGVIVDTGDTADHLLPLIQPFQARVHFADLLALVADCFLQFVDSGLERQEFLSEADKGEIVDTIAGVHVKWQLLYL